MADFPSQQTRALSAHVEGLKAASEALPSDPEAGDSLRRIARSLRTAAEGAGALAVAEAARQLQQASDDGLEEAVRAVLREADALPSHGASGGLEILIVEDNRTVAAALRAYLESPGHTVSHATTAEEAERLLAERTIDVVLLDLILPDRDGRDLLVQMRERAPTADIPVIVLSAKESAVAKAECLAVGAAEFLEKPVEPKGLRSAVARHARPRRDGAATAADDVKVPSRADLVEAYEPLRRSADEGAGAAVALIAVDDFDHLLGGSGEETANRLLETIAGPLAEGLEEHDLVGRWTRGQLVMLFPATDSSTAKTRLQAAMARLASDALLAELAAVDVTPSFSAGVAVAEPGQELRDAVSSAEEALLRARAAGRGVVVRPEGPPDPGGETPDSDPPSLDGDPAGPKDRPRRVLLVEDDRVTATLIHHRLEREGFEVTDFANGLEAFEWAEKASFDLAILDVKVPGMDGFELLERLRTMPRLASVPVVMLTGLGGEDDVVRGLSLGANDYMLKPFSPTELLARVRRLAYADPAGGSGAGGPHAAPAEVGAH